MQYSNSFASALRNSGRRTALLISVGTVGLLLAAFAPESSTTDRSDPAELRQFAQAKAKAKSDAQKAAAKAKADKGDNAKGGQTGQCPPGKTFTPGRGRGAGMASQCL